MDELTNRELSLLRHAIFCMYDKYETDIEKLDFEEYSVIDTKIVGILSKRYVRGIKND